MTARAQDIATRLGLTRHPRSWRGRCPACDYSSTFSLRTGRDGRLILFCASCQDRDALAEAVARATGQQRQPEPSASNDAAAIQRKQDAALRLWRGSEAATGTPVDTYLTRRGLPGLARSDALRYRPDAAHPERGRYPAMVASVTNAAGAIVAVHRTYLSRDGHKANTEPAKASLGPVWGGAIRLSPIAPGEPLVIGEGIETTASAGRLMGFPAWAGISAGNLAKGLVLPPEARRVVIAADPDDAGRKAARDAWTRWTAEGREVRIAVPDISADFNDVLMAQEVSNA
jgi:putative DNA primase/helicase